MSRDPRFDDLHGHDGVFSPREHVALKFARVVLASMRLYRAKNAHSRAGSDEVRAKWEDLRAAQREWRKVLAGFTGERAHYAAFDDGHEASGI